MNALVKSSGAQTNSATAVSADRARCTASMAEPPAGCTAGALLNGPVERRAIRRFDRVMRSLLLSNRLSSERGTDVTHEAFDMLQSKTAAKHNEPRFFAK